MCFNTKRLTIAAFNPFNVEEETPMLFMVQDTLFATMPSNEKIYEVHGDHVHEAAKLDFVPLAIVETK